jgi:Heavy metal associated domain 2
VCHHDEIKLWYPAKISVGAFMLEYVHFVPGRLRLKISALRERRSAAEAEASVSAIPVVKSAVANPTTGSLTIIYDRQQATIGDLWECLRAQGYVSSLCPEPVAIGSSATADPGAGRFGRAFVSAFLEAAVQHSAQALVRALL